MLINVSQGEECRIALVEDGRLEELYMERSSATSHVGNIYKGRVANVEPSIQAAFIDFGLGRNGFLHISDLMPQYFGKEGGDIHEIVGRKLARRDRPPIQRCLRRGDEIIVQIIKEGIGTKGPTLSTYLSIPGRILVMMPGMSRMGVSRKIEDEVERRRLRQILDGLKPPKDVGFIIRTAGVGKTKLEIQRDLTYLTRLWTSFVKKRDSGPGPMELYTEGDLVTRTVRDVFTTDVDRIIIDDKEVAKRVKEVIKLANPRTRNKVELYEETDPLFHHFGIEKEIELMYSRHVPLPSGGSLVIDSTEAIVAIDVNSGKFREHADAETTAFKTDMEAADEIPRQLRLRDLGGVIICDFIDLRYERHRRDLEGRLHANFQKDRAKTKVLRMSQFGIIELTRQRMRPSLKRSIYFDCPHCKGSGLVKTPESMSLDVMRRLAVAMYDARVARVELTVGPEVNFYLQNRKRVQIADLERKSGKPVIIRSDPHIASDEIRLELFDGRDGMVYLEALGMTPAEPPPARHVQHGGRSDGGRGDGGRQDRGRGGMRRGGGRDRNDRGRPPGPQRDYRQRQLPEPAAREEDEEREIDQVEEEVDRREEGEAGEESYEREPDSEPDSESRPDAESGPDSDSEPDAESEDKADLPETIHIPSARQIEHSQPRRDYPDEGNGGEGGPRRRRRGRRGGRGRNRSGGGGGGGYDRGPQPQEQSVGESVGELEIETESDLQGEVVEGEPGDNVGNRADREPNGNVRDDGPRYGDDLDQNGRPRRRRGRRGGRGRRRGGAENAPRSGGYNQQHSEPRPASERKPPASLPAPAPRQDDAPRAAEASSWTRTGSADKHLASDEPVAPQPQQRPRTYRDLDTIPDDFD
jgi:ribonuclease E